MDKKTFFNEVAEQWDTIAPHNLTKVELIIRLLGIKKGATILDIGTGTGVLLPILSRFTNEADITAIDFAEKMIAAAKKKHAHTGITFITADVLEYPFEKEFFDFIICYSMFPHFDHKQDAITHLSGLLKKGGLFSILHSQSREQINNLHADTKETKEDDLPDMHILMEYMRRCGLKEEIMIDNEEMYMVCGRKAARFA